MAFFHKTPQAALSWLPHLQGYPRDPCSIHLALTCTNSGRGQRELQGWSFQEAEQRFSRHGCAPPSPKWGCLPHCVLVALARPVQSPSQRPCPPRPHQRRPLVHTPGSTSWAWLSFARCIEGRGGRNRLSLWPSSLVMSIPPLITSLVSCPHPAPPIRHRHTPGRPSHLPSLPHLDQLCYQRPHPPPPQKASSGCLEGILKILSTLMLWLNVT